MKREFEIGDTVYLKEEEIYNKKRIWTISNITDDGIYYLERIIKRKGTFRFFESARADELVLNT